MAKKKQELSNEERLAAALVREEDWPYQVPGNWVWTYGKVIFKPMSSKKPTGEQFEYIDIDAIDNQLKQVSQPKTIETSEAPSRARRELKTDDVLFSLVRPYLENIAYIDDSLEHCIASTGFFVCRPTEIIIGKYLYYLMISEYAVKGLNAFMKGDNSPSIRKDDIEGFSYPLPPLAEQQRIVDRIERLFDQLDQAKALIQEALDSFATRKAAILHQAFTGALTKKWREEHGVGLESWEQTTLGKCGQWFGGGTPNKSISKYWNNGKIPWVTPKDMKSMYIEDTLDHITEESIKESSAKLIEEPAILFVVRSGILRRILPIAIAEQSVTINQDMKAIIPNKIDLKYLFWFCSCKERDIRDTCSKSGTTVESINSKALFEYAIQIPTKAEQLEIVRILDDLLAKEQNAKDLCDLIDQIEAIKKTILGKAFRGELGTNQAGEASAVELLQQILLQPAQAN